jgi:hypothetical protein
MKQTAKTWMQTILFSVILYITGKFLFDRLFAFFEPAVDGIIFRIRELDGQWRTSTLFSCLLALIPVMVVFMWLFAPVVSWLRRTGSVLVILLFMTAAILVRHQQVKMYFTRVVKPFFLSKGRFNVDYPIDPVNFVYYMFAGLCIGWIISWLLFRQKSNKD